MLPSKYSGLVHRLNPSASSRMSLQRDAIWHQVNFGEYSNDYSDHNSRNNPDDRPERRRSQYRPVLGSGQVRAPRMQDHQGLHQLVLEQGTEWQVRGHSSARAGTGQQEGGPGSASHVEPRAEHDRHLDWILVWTQGCVHTGILTSNQERITWPLMK